MRRFMCAPRVRSVGGANRWPHKQVLIGLGHSLR